MFMVPKKFSQLIPAARGGPVIAINVSKARCDALILRPDHNNVLHIPLNDFTYKDAKQLKRSLHAILRHKNVLRSDRHVTPSSGSTNPEHDFEKILSQLWLCVVRPIFDGMAVTVRICSGLVNGGI
jgi:hypothetical protein